jgi:predicted transcriptional regulator YdeE
MEPKIIQKEAFIIAGVVGHSSDETAKAWEALMNIQKLHPLENQVGEEGFEVRVHPEDSPMKIHVGVAVKDANIPPEYKVFYVPAATYAEFEIYPAKGYESSNDAMNQWLIDNSAIYKEALLDGSKYGIEVYDQRYKGEKGPDSVVGIWIPLTATGMTVK